MEIVEGEGTGDSATTDASGSYTFVGLSGDVTVRASSTGLDPLDEAVSMTEDRMVSFALMTPPVVTMCLDLDDEEVYITNDDTVNELILDGFVLLEEIDGNAFTFVEDRSCRDPMSGFTLAPGATVIITSGDSPTHSPPTHIAGWCSDTWEGSGDSARLSKPNGDVVATVIGGSSCGG